MRLDGYLVNKNIFETRSKATLSIKDGEVKVNGRIVTKAGYEVKESDVVTVNKKDDQFVSRGGYKLLGAINEFKIDLIDKIVFDIGASTGGFTDCALQHNAKLVYAYDVGTDQLDKKLLENPKVISKQNINCRNLTANDFDNQIDFICMDVSFISCNKMFDAISSILSAGKEAVILFKPQFEVGSNHLNRQGIVTNDKIVLEKLADTINFAKSKGLILKGKMTSPIKGKQGNTEYLLYFVKQ